MIEKIKNIIQASVDVKNKILANDKLLQSVKDCVYVLVTAFKNGNKVLFCGNGGSAAGKAYSLEPTPALKSSVIASQSEGVLVDRRDL